MTQPQTQQLPAQPQEHPVAATVTTAVALDAIRRGLPDPFLPLRWARLASVVRAERRVLGQYRAAIADWTPAVARRVVQHGAIDPHAVRFAARGFETAARPIVEIELREVFETAFREASEADWTPDADAYLKRYLDGAWNRLRATPDRVYSLITREVATASRNGDDMDTLAAKIDGLFAEHDVPTWTNRGLTVARTEAISAHNAGNFASYVAMAKQDGGAWDKVWLATEDERTRPTHVRADLQRVPLHAPFTVGGFPGMFPGDPTLPAREVINCRCAPLAVRAGEKIDLSHRQFKEAA